MTDPTPDSTAPGQQPVAPAPTDTPTPLSDPARPPFSQLAIWGFVVSCISLLVFGFIGVLGAVLSSYALRGIRAGRARGRGLAIAGWIIGALGFLYYAYSFITAHLGT